MLLSFHLIIRVLRVLRKPCLPPRVADCLHADVVLHADNPLGDIMVRGSGNWNVGILQHQPSKEFVAPLAFEQLVVANVGWLDKPRAASGDELNLHAEGLDGVDAQQHLMDLKLVQ